MTAKLWRKDGTLITTLTRHTAAVLEFPKSRSSEDRDLGRGFKIWTREGFSSRL